VSDLLSRTTKEANPATLPKNRFSTFSRENKSGTFFLPGTFFQDWEAEVEPQFLQQAAGRKLKYPVWLTNLRRPLTMPRQ